MKLYEECKFKEALDLCDKVPEQEQSSFLIQNIKAKIEIISPKEDANGKPIFTVIDFSQTGMVFYITFSKLFA